MYFYDTCALLNELENAFKEPFVVSTITFGELEDIKSSRNKDEDVKSKARQLLKLLQNNREKYYISAYLEEELENLIQERGSMFSLCSNDSKIISCAVVYSRLSGADIIFRTDDVACGFLAEVAGLKVDTKPKKEKQYLGFQVLDFKSENETISFYSGLPYCPNPMNENEYLFISVNGHIIDKYKYKDSKLHQIHFPCFESAQLGKIKPKDEYQYIAMDCLRSNQLCLLRGPAGSGKSYLAMAYLFDQLEKGKIDKIIIFCNTVATLGSAKLGYYPGSKDEKLLDSQIGNFLASKLGGIEEVKKKIDNETIVLLPMSDVRGYDTTGMNAGIYITEAQNLDIELMRLALQRVGEDSICIIEGDDNTQVDSVLYAGSRNGIKKVSEIFRGQEFFGEVTLQTIHRSKIAEIAQKM